VIRILFLIAAALFATPAHAQWREATSRNFIVYSDGDERGLREAVIRLERYNHALRALSNVTRPPSATKLKVYLLRNVSVLSQFAGQGPAGYYVASARGPIAVSIRRGPRTVSTLAVTTREDTNAAAEEVLLHEYAHHFMFQNFPATYPWWFVEAFAGFYGPAIIRDDGGVEIGHGAMWRQDALREGWLPIHRILTARRPQDINGEVGLLYAQGWLTVHYLFNQRGGAAQLQRYLEAVNAGTSYEAAVEAVWGPQARELDSALRRYAREPLRALHLPFRPIDIGPVEVRALSEAENDLLFTEIHLGSGISRAYVGRFSQSVRSLAGRYSGDPYALRILAEAERLAGNRAQAEQAVNRLLAIRPEDPKGLLFRGLLNVDALRESNSRDEAAWNAARAPLLRANRLAPNDAQVLLAYYDSYRGQDSLPPAHAQNALVRAMNLVPQDDLIRYRVAADYERRDMIEEAIFTIRPDAYATHEDENEAARRRRERNYERYGPAGEERRETAREMLTRLETRLAQQRGTATPPAPAPAPAQ